MNSDAQLGRTSPGQSALFTELLVADVSVAIGRFKADGLPVNRRELIRSAFAAIEGIHWEVKQNVLSHAKMTLALNPHETAALMEESYSLGDNGKVKRQDRFLPMRPSIKLVVSIIQRMRPGYAPDFTDRGWADLESAIGIRNRLVHPKSLAALDVTDDELYAAISALTWVLRYGMEAMNEALAHTDLLLSRPDLMAALVEKG